MLRWGSLTSFLQSDSLMMTLLIVFMINIATMSNFVLTVMIQAASQFSLIYLRDSHVNLENALEKINIMNVIIMLTIEKILLLILSINLYV